MLYRLFTTITVFCVSLFTVGHTSSSINVPVKKIEAHSKYNRGYFSRLKKGFYNPSDSTQIDSAYVDLQGRMIYKFSVKDDSVHYEFLRRLNDISLSYDTSIVVHADSAATYMRRARGKEQGAIPSWKVGNIELDNGNFDVWASTCGNITYSYPEESFLNDFNIQITVGTVYEATLGDSCILEIHESAWSDGDSSSPVVIAKNEYGCTPDNYRPEILDGVMYKRIKTRGDVVRTGEESYFRIEGFTADHDSLTVSPVDPTAIPTYQLSENQLNALAPYLSKAKADGKLLLIDFWGTWCNPCLQVMPRISTLLKMFSDKVSLLGVCVDSPDNFATAAKLLQDNGLNGMEVFEEHGKKDGISAIMEISAFPTYILLSPDGNVMLRGSGLDSIGSLGDVLGSAFGFPDAE